MNGLFEYWTQKKYITLPVNRRSAIFVALLNEKEDIYEISNIRFIPNDKNVGEACKELRDFNGNMFTIEKKKEDFESQFEQFLKDLNCKSSDKNIAKEIIFRARISNNGIHIFEQQIIYGKTFVDFLENLDDKNIKDMNESQKANYIFNTPEILASIIYKDKNKKITSISDDSKFEKKINEEIKIFKEEIEEKLNSIKTVYSHELYKTKEEIKNKYIQEDEKLKENIEEKINKLEEMINNYKDLIDTISYLPILNKKETNAKYFEKQRPKNIINKIISYLYYSENLYYDPVTIKQFYSALCTNQIVVLSGKPGTGKTSLEEGFCKATGIKNKIISVQPNWNDNQDLLGFYNPIEKIYVSSPLVDFIVEANINKDLLYVVCLDEMNLSQTEYYLSEFLSKLETNDKIIELYSEDVYINNYRNTLDTLKYIISRYGKENKKSITDPRKIIALNIDDFNDINLEIFKIFNKEKERLINYITYNNKVIIPNNFRIVGTINKDEYTKDLSPKVIDRSAIMEIKKTNVENVKNIIGSLKQTTPLKLAASCFELDKKIAFDDELKELLNEIKNLFKNKLNIDLNNRFDRHVIELYQSNMFNDNYEFLDIIKLMKIVPKINMYVDSDDKNEFFASMKSLFSSNMPESYDVYKEMERYCKENDVFTFWR